MLPARSARHEAAPSSLLRAEGAASCAPPRGFDDATDGAPDDVVDVGVLGDFALDDSGYRTSVFLHDLTEKPGNRGIALSDDDAIDAQRILFLRMDGDLPGAGAPQEHSGHVFPHGRMVHQFAQPDGRAALASPQLGEGGGGRADAQGIVGADAEDFRVRIDDFVEMVGVSDDDVVFRETAGQERGLDLAHAVVGLEETAPFVGRSAGAEDGIVEPVGQPALGQAGGEPEEHVAVVVAGHGSVACQDDFVPHDVSAVSCLSMTTSSVYVSF